MTGQSFLLLEEATILLLLTASAVAIAARRLRIPYTVGLVLMGLVLGLLNVPRIEISPEKMMPPPALVQVGGATVFSIEVDSYQEF